MVLGIDVVWSLGIDPMHTSTPMLCIDARRDVHGIHPGLGLSMVGTTNHEKTLMDVGRAMSSVALEKYERVSTSSPTVNMWCAQTK